MPPHFFVTPTGANAAKYAPVFMLKFHAHPQPAQRCEPMSAPTAKIVLLGVLGNAALALIKGVAGVFGHSYALIADAIESTTDVFSSLLLYLGLRVANQPPDANHPYGHGRAESLAM